MTRYKKYCQQIGAFPMPGMETPAILMHYLTRWKITDSDCEIMMSDDFTLGIAVGRLVTEIGRDTTIQAYHHDEVMEKDGPHG